MTVLFRPIAESDLDSVHELSQYTGYGLTTLSKDKEELKKRIEISIQSFSKQTDTPLDENYFFVLEDVEHQKIIGTSAIEAFVGYNLPFYSYRLTKLSKTCRQLDIHLVHKVLMLTNDFHGYSEVGTLFLHPDYRHSHNGLLLSLARFLFVACFKERFADNILAEMRGVSDEYGCSPFWESLGKHFFAMSFTKADELSVLTDKQFIADLMPHNPIYTALLSEEAQAVIGNPHPTTLPAMKILQKEGFQKTGCVDLFDAGPTIASSTNKIKTVRRSFTLEVKDICESNQFIDAYISNTNLSFKATRGGIDLVEDGCRISEAVAKTLDVREGDVLRVLTSKKRKSSK